MQITVALDGEKKRDLRFFAGDDMSLTIVVYAHDGDVTPITVENVRFAAADGSLPMDVEFVVPSNFLGRAPYRIVGEVEGITTTLCYGVMQTDGGWPCVYCWGYCGPGWGIVGKAENITVLDAGNYFDHPTNVELALQYLASTFGGEAAQAAAASALAAQGYRDEAGVQAGIATDAAGDAVAARDEAVASATTSTEQAVISTTKAVEAADSAAAAAVSEANAANSEQAAFEASGLFVDLAAFDAVAVDDTMGGIKSANLDIAYDLAQKVAGVSTLTGVSVPSAKATGRAVSLTDRLSSNSFKLFKQRTGLLKAKLDINGDLRGYETSDTGELPAYYGVPVNALSKAQLSIATTQSLSTLKNFPSSVTLIQDVSGGFRILKVVDVNRSAQPVLYGAATSGNVALPTEYYVFLIAGQSNADGRGNSLQSPTVPAGVAYQFYSGALTPLVDPVGTASTGSAWPSFAIEFWQRTGYGVIIVPTAVGGSSVVAAAQPGSNWDTSGTLRAAAITKLNASFAYLNANNYAWQFGGNIWWEGEQAAYSIDHAVAGVTKAIYKTAFQNMVSANVADLGAHTTMVIRVGRESTGDTSGYQQIRAAQDELCKSIADVQMAYTGVFNFPTRGLMNGDGTLVHVGQTGLNEVGRKMAVVAETLCLGNN